MKKLKECKTVCEIHLWHFSDLRVCVNGKINGQKWVDYERRSRLQMFSKIGVFKNVCKFHRKTLVLESLLNETCNFIKRRPQYRCYPVKFAKFLRTTFFIEHFWSLLLLRHNFMFYFSKVQNKYRILQKGIASTES